MKAAILLASALLLMPAGAMKAGAAGRADPRSTDCRDDRGVDRCDAAQHRKVLEKYRMQPIEAHAAAGDIVRRVFFVDGYGRDLVAISFVRPRGKDPSLSVQVPVEAGARQRPILTAAVPASVWDDVIERSARFDEQLARLAPQPEPKRKGKSGEDEKGDIVLCIHSWVYTVEAVDQKEGGAKGQAVRRKTEDACDHGLVQSYAHELAKAAVPLLPPCVLLDPRQHRGLPSLLSACTLLTGDRLAAAEVMNELEAFRSVEGPGDEALLRGVFDYRAELDWQGTRSTAGGEAAKLWAAKAAEGGRANLYWEAIEGLSADRVRFAGLLSRSLEDADGKSRYQRAPVEQIWRREGGRFAVERATVGPWKDEG